MRIKFQAFLWETKSQKFTVPLFLEKLKQDTPIKLGSKHIYVIKDQDYYFGVLLTVKDFKKFTKLVQENQEYKVDVHKLSQNENIVDLNFFIFDTQKNYGMYQFYHNSCSLLTFNSTFSKLYKNNLDQIKKNFIETLSEDTSRYRKSRLLKPYHGRLETSIVENQKNFKDKLQQLANILYFESSFIENTISDPLFSPSSSHVNRYKIITSFDKEFANTLKLQNVLETLSKITPKRAKVRGTLADGSNIEYKLISDFQNFGEYDYDDMVTSLSLNHENFEQSIKENPIITTLKSTYEENPF